MAQTIKPLHQGYRFLNPQTGRPRPNVYRRSLEARENTNAYLAAVERKAAGVDEPTEDTRTAHYRRVYTVLALGVVVLLLVAVVIYAGVMR